MQNFLPLPGNDALRVPLQPDAWHAEVARHSRRDASRLSEWQQYVVRAADVLRALSLQTPPTDPSRCSDLWQMLRVGMRLRQRPLSELRLLHELFTRSAGDILDDWFESEPLKALYGFDSIVGNYASPYTPGSGYVLLHHAFGEVNGRRGVWGHALGGMGSITRAMAAEARARGVQIHLGDAVERIEVHADRACGVVLSSGRRIGARAVAANVNPKLLYLRLLEPRHLPDEFLTAIRRYRCASASFRINVALSELPDFHALRAGAPGGIAAGNGAGDPLDPLRAGIILAPSLGYMDRAHAEARLQGYSSAPVIEMLIPSTLDDSLAPRGAHVASLFCQHFAPELPQARPWSAARDEMANLIFQTLEQYAPNFRRSLLAYSALTPADLEERFGLIGGDIFHGALALDQIWAARPVLGYGDYRSPVTGLYLCGAGAHPGGGVTGLPGHNAARRILSDWRQLRRHSGAK